MGVKIFRTFKYKLFWLFLIIGALPLMIVLVVNGFRRVSNLEAGAESEMWIKTTAIDNHITNMLSNNMNVLHATAVNPSVQRYVMFPDEAQRAGIEQIIKDTNWILKDGNAMALTDAQGQQLFRTDSAPLVNIAERDHFHRAMQGKDYASNLIKSRSTGEQIVVLEVPVKDNSYKVVGMLQRNFNIDEFQSFVGDMSDEKSSVVLLDREGNVLVHTNPHLLKEARSENPLPYQVVSQAMSGVFGVVRMEVDGVDSLVGYKRNSITGWPIAIIFPYRHIVTTVNQEIYRLAVLGLLCLLGISVMAYRFSGAAARPIVRALRSAKDVAQGTGGMGAKGRGGDSSSDEVEEISRVMEEIRAERDAYRLETERDTMTGLYSEKAMESVCARKLLQYQRDRQGYDLIVFYLVALDRFKGINEKYGRPYGDRVILEFAERLRKSFRPLDTVGRISGDEFLVVADQVSETPEVLRKAESLNKLARSLVLDGENVEMTASIGVAFFPQNGAGYGQVLQAARTALGKARDDGRDNFYCLAV